MAQGFVIGMVALGAGLALLQKQRSEMAAAQSAQQDNANGGPTVEQEQQAQSPPPSGGASAASHITASDDGTTGGSTSTSPSTPPANMAGIGAVNTCDLSESDAALVDHGVVPHMPGGPSNGTGGNTPSESTVKGEAAPSPPIIPPIAQRDVLIASTYGLGQRVTKKQESDNQAAVGPSMGVVW